MRWKVSLGPFASLHGICASPILADGKIVLLIDQAQDSFVAAFDRNDGHLLWKTARPDAAGGYSTPLAYVLKGRALLVIVSSPRELVGYSAENGEKVWWVEQMGFQPQTSPILDQDTVYANVFGGSEYWENTEDFGSIDKDHDGKITAAEFPESWGQLAGSILDANQDAILTPSEWQAFGRRIRGGGASALLAVRLGGRGNLTERAVAWRFTKSLPGISSPVLYKHVLYLVKGGVIVTALDPAAGRVLNQTRLIGALDDYFSSPVAAEDKIYLTSLSGKVSVLKAGTGLQILAMNDLHDECYASPAVGLSDAVVVETSDAVLVASKDEAQKVKDIVGKLDAAKRTEHVSHRRVYRPWGYYESIDAGDRFQVKRLMVKPGAALSLQMHHHRAEHWVVVSGTAKVTRGEEVTLVAENESTYIPIGTKHRLENPGKVPLHLIEVQSGGYLGEDDIVRFEDLYKRS
jgi:mannose-6-phosphate isomerase-like protein (cupin superfamily)/outer membrane protein assembly factor BamB